MTYVALRKYKTAELFCLLLFSSMAILGVLSVFDAVFRSYFCLLAAIEIIVISWLYKSHILSSYEYIIDPHEDILRHNRITIIRTHGKKRTSIATLSLKNLTAVVPYMRPKEFSAKYGAVKEKMNFCADIYPKESYLLIFEINGKLYTIRLQCDAEFANILAQRAGI